MASKGKPKATTVKRDPNTLVAQARPNEEDATTLARTVLRPSIKGAVTIKEYSKKYGDLDLIGLVGELSDQAKAANDGDLKRAEGMLMVQAHTLDTIFNELARLAALNMGEYLDATDRYMRMALKAQSQCRTTLETLAVIKNPPNVAFVKQANIAHNQQVNNAPAIPSRAREIENPQNELLEVQDGKRLDTRTTSTTVGADPALETVGGVNGAANAKG